MSDSNQTGSFIKSMWLYWFSGLISKVLQPGFNFVSENSHWTQQENSWPQFDVCSCAFFKGKVKGKHLNLFWNVGPGTVGSIAVTLNKNRPSTGAGVSRFIEATDNRVMRFAHLSCCYHKVTRTSWTKKNVKNNLILQGVLVLFLFLKAWFRRKMLAVQKLCCAIFSFRVGKMTCRGPFRPQSFGHCFLPL